MSNRSDLSIHINFQGCAVSEELQEQVFASDDVMNEIVSKIHQGFVSGEELFNHKDQTCSAFWHIEIKP